MVYNQQVKYPGYFVLSKDKLPAIELEIFSNNLAVFNQPELKTSTVLQTNIIKTVHLIEQEIEAKKRKNEHIDYRFYTKILENLGNLAEYTSRDFSIGKNVLAGLMVILGCCLIAASITCFFYTVGAGAPLTALGMGLGLSMLNTHLILGITSAAMAVGGMHLSFFKASI